jgi:hypothetical protein
MMEFPPGEADIGGDRPLGSISRTRTVAGIQSGFAQKLDNENPRLGDITTHLSFGIFKYFDNRI